MEFDAVCFACHKVLSIHSKEELGTCLKDLSERFVEIQKVMGHMDAFLGLSSFAIGELEKSFKRNWNE